jgi:3-phenylpropionate/cinnamic acid dioxygenase small subunit
MTAPETLQLAEAVLYREALLLDERRWDDWVALYDEQAEFWVPAWRDESEPTEDPETEISLIYITSRLQLEERISRVRSGRSAASTPLPRTAHVVSNVMVLPGGGDDAMTVSSIATVHNFDLKRREQHVYFSRCEHRLARTAGDGEEAWRIQRKKLVLLNDYIPMALDFYSI